MLVGLLFVVCCMLYDGCYSLRVVFFCSSFVLVIDGAFVCCWCCVLFVVCVLFCFVLFVVRWLLVAVVCCVFAACCWLLLVFLVCLLFF